MTSPLNSGKLQAARWLPIDESVSEGGDMPCYGCTMCNKCGKLDRMKEMGSSGARICPQCGYADDGFGVSICPKCGTIMPPRAMPPGENAFQEIALGEEVSPSSL